MSHLIGVAVLIWIAITYGIWTAIGFFVLYAIVAFGVIMGLYSIAAWREERAICSQERRRFAAYSLLDDSANRFWLILTIIVNGSLFVVVIFPARSEPNTTIPALTAPAGRITITAPAGPCTQLCILPPVEYDHPYAGKLTLERVPTREHLRMICGNAFTQFTLACSFVYKDSCRIVLVDDQVIRARGWAKEAVMRHEIGHCNGWPGDHPGQRRYDVE